MSAARVHVVGKSAGPLQVFARWLEKRREKTGDTRVIEGRSQPQAGQPLTRDYYFDGAAVRRVQRKVRGKSARRAEKAARRVARERAAYLAMTNDRRPER